MAKSHRRRAALPRIPSTLLAVALVLLAISPAHALRTKGNDWPINLGITGALGDLKPDAPKTIVVTEVRPGTPAAGKLQVGDQITGVNGRKFRKEHKFGYGMDKFGYEGPLMDFGNALVDSQDAKYARQARANAKCIGKNYNTFFDTHGSPILGTAWTALGAATDPKTFRTVMDEHAWFFNLSQCPDGTFYYMPNRD